MHTPVRSKTRKEVQSCYKVYEVKRDLVNENIYDNVDSPASVFYASIDPRRRVEIADAGMVAEDNTAISNLSGKAIIQEYPANNFSAGFWGKDNSVQE